MASSSVISDTSNHAEAASSKNGVLAGRLELVLEQELDLELQSLDGIGPKTAERLAERGVADQLDLLLWLPRRYQKIHRHAGGELLVAERSEYASFTGEVVSVRKPGRYGKRPLEVIVECDGHRFVCVWFNMRAKRFIKAFRIGRWVEVEGSIDWERSLPRLAHPTIRWRKGPSEARCEIGFDPVYPGIDKVSPKVLRRAIEQSAENVLPHLVDVVPARLRGAMDLGSIRDALRTLHVLGEFGDAVELEAALERSRDRLVYEEFYTLQRHLALQLAETRGRGRAPRCEERELGREFVRGLPFALTGDQKRTVATLAAELGRGVPMRRLLQGDVGSGKTVVAFTAASIAVDNGCQVALMAPTEVLATQHYEKARAMFGDLDVTIGLLTGSTGAAERRAVVERAMGGGVDVLIGTHALFSDDVGFDNLGLVIVDEQHKFGVEQRERLLGLGEDPHLLAMTATPIPRTLAHALFGDLELVVLREKPPGRQPVRTHLRNRRSRDDIYAWVHEEITERGRQAYVVFPLIEEAADGRDLQNLLDGCEELANGPLRGTRVGVLHGRMSSDDKLDIMGRFARGEVDVLCSTTVIEVGVDVPNATVMVIESPEAFGLSQLHQLRGRVGRGDARSRCILVCGDRMAESTAQRLESFVATDDGFELAEIDLVTRGPGEFLGQRQAGVGNFRFADLVRDREWLAIARRDVRREVFGEVASNP
jgi:ATP-dependent DNA helicase RecG